MEQVAPQTVLVDPRAELPAPVPNAFTAVGLGALAGGAIYVAAKIAGLPSAMAALGGAVGGAVLGGIKALASMAQRKVVEPCEEDLEVAVQDLKSPEIAVVVSFLREHLGTEITAYLSGSDDTGEVERWVLGEAPGPLPAGRLVFGYETVRPIVHRYDGLTAKSWLFGTNPWLKDEAPAYVLRHSERPEIWQEVVEAAQDFVGFER